MSAPAADPFDLSRFVAAQSSSYSVALNELQAGQKRSHWMWFIFPQVAGLGSSGMARRYAIRSRAEAVAYLQHPILGARLEACVVALLQLQGRSAEQVMGYPDWIKLQSSMTLFAEISPPGSCFEQLLQKYYDGKVDAPTLAFLSQPEQKSA